jgi:hypothetical protein
MPGNTGRQIIDDATCGRGHLWGGQVGEAQPFVKGVHIK